MFDNMVKWLKRVHCSFGTIWMLFGRFQSYSVILTNIWIRSESRLLFIKYG